ncbi:hypothetical protein AMTRI_Chr05g63980 [Amborella trichopoda]|uniref:RING-type E3 ubiquitin transferase n=1 Tax=Amborella trichopoda TaxID=13333 RepID=W1NN90_AMBTC|nr:uncharacterized protein LOC18425033 [Amborella trichopoda]ERM97083.1 hypothetical protein AMTR_s00122p00129500 [Amborella trichopoda]|eukprot:XP_006829667.1 uncharacterized protein LOC18425033 [Amborella trichopoda]
MDRRRLVLCLYVTVALLPGLAFSQFPDINTLIEVAQENYDRYPEVQKECGSFISQASELKKDEHMEYKYTLRNELSFSEGDWVQKSGDAPLMPFGNGKTNLGSGNDMGFLFPQKLASFSVGNIAPIDTRSRSMNISGSLQLAILNNTIISQGYSQSPFSPHFELGPSYSLLTVIFQGVYMESERNGGERTLCMLGNTLLPSRQVDSTDPWPWLNTTSYYQPHLLEDENILLVLHYPMKFTLTSRAIRGEMQSFNRNSNPKYFDSVRISSQLGAYSNYQFGSEKLVAKACDPYPYRDNVIDKDIELVKGREYCGILERFSSGETFKIVPNWNCNVTDEYCSKLGPFDSAADIKATDGAFNNVKLVIRDIRCEPRFNSSSARIASVFRAITPSEDPHASAQRSGLNGMVLSAEGIWNSSIGQLCMVGCLGNLDKGMEVCNSRICLYVFLTFSIKQRNLVSGTISSIKNGSDSYYPLSFERLVNHPSELWNVLGSDNLSYKYTKIGLAGAFLERTEPYGFGDVIKKSLLNYPQKEKGRKEFSLSLLSEDLTLHISAVPDPPPKARFRKTFVQLEMLTIGSFFGGYWLRNASYGDLVDKRGPVYSNAEPTEKKLLLNVSAELKLTGTAYENVSTLFLEGLYDEIVGKMYLIGCRDVRASWKVLFESMDLEDGLDCLIEVKIEYPPTTAHWLMSPSAKISISSQRNEDDPLYFPLIKLQTFPIMYRRQREEIISRKGVEGALRILTLSVMISCILSQLFYIRDKAEVVPFISLMMLGVQALGYSIPLITGAEALFERVTSEPYDERYMENYRWFNVIDYAIKMLVLVAFLLTLRLGQKVWKARIRLLTRAPLEPGRVPSDRRVFFTCLGIHSLGFVLILIVHSLKAGQRPLNSETYIDSRGYTHKQREWETELKEYIGLVQDFFLLPQIVGNFLWQIDCKPLRKAYYIGVTIVRLLPHVYDYIRAPVFNPYFSEEYEFVNPSLDFYSKFGDVAIPVTAFVLAIIVYVQQRWSYQKLRQTLLKQGKLLPLGSRAYERLPSRSFEAELVTGVNETATVDHVSQDEQ